MLDWWLTGPLNGVDFALAGAIVLTLIYWPRRREEA